MWLCSHRYTTPAFRRVVPCQTALLKAPCYMLHATCRGGSLTLLGWRNASVLWVHALTVHCAHGPWRLEMCSIMHSIRGCLASV